MEIISPVANVSSVIVTNPVLYPMHEGAKSPATIETTVPASPTASMNSSPSCAKPITTLTKTSSPLHCSPPLMSPLSVTAGALGDPGGDRPPFSSSTQSEHHPEGTERAYQEPTQALNYSGSETSSSTPTSIHTKSEQRPDANVAVLSHNSLPTTTSNSIYTDMDKLNLTSNATTAPEWTQVLQQFASFCYSKAKPTMNFVSSVPDNAPSPLPKDSTDSAERFQTILTTISQLLLNSPTSLLASKQAPEIGTTASNSSHPLKESATILSTAPSHHGEPKLENNLSGLPVTLASFPVNGVTPNPMQFFIPPTGVPPPSSPLALTASLMAMMTTPKPGNKILSESVSDLNPYLCSSMLPTSASSQSTYSSGIRSLFPAPNMPQSTQMPEMETNDSKFSGFGLSEGRDLLYQLGQRLMAMASAPAVPEGCLLKQSGWNASTSTANFIPPSEQLPMLHNPMATIMNSSMFSHFLPAAQGFPLSNGPTLTSSEKKTGSFPVSMSNVTIDKGTHPLPASGASLSGISMRGNQKYSAYYQHQRKQGFQMNMTQEYGNANPTRRQNTTIASSLSGARYSGRRFRSGLTNSALNSLGQMDARAGQRGTGLRGQVCAPGGSVFANFRGASYKHSLSNPIVTVNSHPSKPSDPLISVNSTASGAVGGTVSVGNTGTEHTSGATRLRDTAFLCSCGKDFESLYVFTLHMRDTGHKPKSDQSERDIPKLVRGQDMWINSETEQTREILRCMRCHQSFRNLPELTMHMMKTNHYSEIVYNDSGRLVFVNPDEHRHKPSATSTSNNSSPSKLSNYASSHTTGRRGSRASFNPAGNTNASLAWSNGLLSPGSVDSGSTMEKSEPASSSTEEGGREVNSAQDSKISALFDHKEDGTWGTVDQGKRRKLDSTNAGTNDSVVLDKSEANTPSERPSESPGPPVPRGTANSPLCEASLREAGLVNTGCADSSSEPRGQKLEGSVLRQIESFVESKLPRGSHGLSGRANNCSVATSQRSSPPFCGVESVSSYSATNNEYERSPMLNQRKRTHSEASLSQTCSPTSSPVCEVDSKTKQLQCVTEQRASISSSPIKVTSTSELNTALLESPLSSLQKLVETTHKPVPPSSAFSTSNSSTLYVTCNQTMPSTKPVVSNRSGCGVANSNNRGQYSPGRKTPSGSGNSTGSTISNFAQLISPTSEQDSLIPALSALYAYVEKSSPCQIHESQIDPRGKEASITPSRNERTDSLDNNHASKAHGTQELTASSAIQAFYAAAMSSLAAQYLNTPSTGNSRAPTPDDPLHVFRKAALDFKDALEMSAGATSTVKTDLAESWIKMLQLFGGQPDRQEFSDEPLSSDSSEPAETNTGGLCVRGSPQQRRQQVYSSKTSENDDIDDYTLDQPLPPCSFNPTSTHPVVNVPHVVSTTGVQNFSSTPVNATTNYQTVLPRIQTSKYHSVVPMRSVTSCSGSANLMSTMITKKAKCHFCGKPFANKGQVRLHISKNKCPCLLQQSCHVAALAAAFGSESRQHLNPPQTSAAAIAGSLSAPTSKFNLSNSIISGSGAPAMLEKLPTFTSPSYTAHPDDSLEVPSALSLLKERFQNFDLLRSTTPARSSGVNNYDNGLNCLPFPSSFGPLPPRSAANDKTTTSQSFVPFRNQQCGLWQDIHPTSVAPMGFSDGGNISTNHNTTISSSGTVGNFGISGDSVAARATASAANASHLAAMALLAQTLVQLTSSQAPRIPTATENIVDANTNLFSPTTLLQRILPTSVSGENTNTFPLMNPMNFDLEVILNQANIAKQLVAMNWNGQLMSSGLEGDASNATGPSISNRATAPNGFP
ncbi:uncharacterized protein DEA37_0005680 [Paragonimus westermani]|uniref:C2H2-type domain-containing protein n=1 Tax=Paragonimus westermani TaxID=34504 RepID=A0A5J4P1D1_9TREM|nr:uncharacterized protein DEA37_0005680 [Paragonimus westermani]